MELSEKQTRLTLIRRRMNDASDTLAWANTQLSKIYDATGCDYVLSAESNLITSIDYLDDALNDIDFEISRVPLHGPTAPTPD